MSAHACTQVFVKFYHCSDKSPYRSRPALGCSRERNQISSRGVHGAAEQGVVVLLSVPEHQKFEQVRGASMRPQSPLGLIDGPSASSSTCTRVSTPRSLALSARNASTHKPRHATAAPPGTTRHSVARDHPRRSCFIRRSLTRTLSGTLRSSCAARATQIRVHSLKLVICKVLRLRGGAYRQRAMQCGGRVARVDACVAQ